MINNINYDFVNKKTKQSIKNEIHLNNNAIIEFQSNSELYVKFISIIINGLHYYPHYLKITGIPPTENVNFVAEIVRAVANCEPVKPDMSIEERLKITFTPIEINSNTTNRISERKQGTYFSRTNQPLPPHTDSSYDADPDELVAFQMVRSDAGGGDTLIFPVEDVIAGLETPTRDILQRPIFPFGEVLRPILWNRAQSPCIRYYRANIEKSAQQFGHALLTEAANAMNALDSVLDRKGIVQRFRIEAGEILLMHNNKVLHGRTGFAQDSNRLMYRIRKHIGCL